MESAKSNMSASSGGGATVVHADVLNDQINPGMQIRMMRSDSKGSNKQTRASNVEQVKDLTEATE